VSDELLSGTLPPIVRRQVVFCLFKEMMMNLMKLTGLAGLLFSGAALSQVCDANIVRTRPDSHYEAVAGVSPAGSEVRDKLTGLIWQRCVQGMSWSGSTCTGSAGSYTWVQALDRARTATPTSASLSSAWRLPNKKELYSLPERACSSPAINSTWFPAEPGGWAWSASPVAGFPDVAWRVYFSDGYGYYGYGFKSLALQVRLVRSGQ
jgi:hypothetical protein